MSTVKPDPEKGYNLIMVKKSKLKLEDIKALMNRPRKLAEPEAEVIEMLCIEWMQSHVARWEGNVLNCSGEFFGCVQPTQLQHFQQWHGEQVDQDAWFKTEREGWAWLEKAAIGAGYQVENSKVTPEEIEAAPFYW